ncbi:MAG: DUF7577 domain-containing protein [Planctomycetota bacterium]|jgi:flagellar biosynthesis protein FliQ
MYSVKPGRGPSLLAAVASLLFCLLPLAMLVGVNLMISHAARQFDNQVPFWIGRIIFSVFLVVFFLMTLMTAVYNFINFRKRNRMSAIDITTGSEEPDPISTMMGYAPGADTSGDTGESTEEGPRRFEGRYCPFCGGEVQDNFDFCPKCGKDI